MAKFVLNEQPEESPKKEPDFVSDTFYINHMYCPPIDGDFQLEARQIITDHLVLDVQEALSPREFFVEVKWHEKDRLFPDCSLVIINIGNMLYDTPLFRATTVQEIQNKVKLLKHFLAPHDLDDDPNILASIANVLRKINVIDHPEVHVLASELNHHMGHVHLQLQGRLP